jgi:hypothetical protein
MSRSDSDLAGLALRCAAGGIEALVIVVAPLPPARSSADQIRFPGKAKGLRRRGCSTFHRAALAAPAPSFAAALDASGADSLAIEVDRDDGPVRGTVALAGPTTVLEGLTANCSHL